MRIVLHGYWRSTSSYRVRIALAQKGLAYDYRPVNLLEGAQHGEGYRALSPSGLVPALDVDGRVTVESLAICELLEELVPTPALWPADPFERAFARSVALTIASGIQPFQNLKVLQKHPPEERPAAARAVIEPGLAVLEALLASRPGPFCCGAEPSFADVFLVPQVYAARRFSVDLTPFPRVVAADAAAAELPAFQLAHPDRQADAVR